MGGAREVEEVEGALSSRRQRLATVGGPPTSSFREKIRGRPKQTQPPCPEDPGGDEGAGVCGHSNGDGRDVGNLKVRGGPGLDGAEHDVPEAGGEVPGPRKSGAGTALRPSGAGEGEEPPAASSWKPFKAPLGEGWGTDAVTTHHHVTVVAAAGRAAARQSLGKGATVTREGLKAAAAAADGSDEDELR